MIAVSLPVGTRSRSAPWRTLTTLALLVLATHLLVLQASSPRMGPPLNPDTAVRSFSTRSMTPQPAVRTAPVPPTAPATVQAPTQQKKALKEPLAQFLKGPEAIDFVATTTPEAPEIIAPTPAEDPINSTPAVSTATVAAISAAPLPVVPAPALQAGPTPPVSTTAASAVPAGPTPTVVTAISLPGSARLQYKVVGTSKGLNYFADAELNWNNTGTQYDATMKVSALFVGSRSMTSRGAVTATGLAPTRFADKYKSELAAHFDADKGKVSFSANTPDALWLEGTQDRVSVFLQLGGMLAAGPTGSAGPGPSAFAVGSSITLYTVGPRDADTWTFLVEAAEQLSLPGGDLATLKLTRKPRREYDQKVEVWYAPALGYLPVRNRITQANGDFVDQQLKNIDRP